MMFLTTVWVLILTHTVPMLDVSVIAQHQHYLFTTQAVCEQARPLVEELAPALAPKGFTVPLTWKLTRCMRQDVLSEQNALRELESLRQ
jgi:hypothetical protein